VAPNTVNLISGEVQQFSVTVIGTTNTAVTWYACGGTIDQTGLFLAPVVTGKTSICVFAISQADPSKSSTAYAFVSPAPPNTICPKKSIYDILKPGTGYYTLPSWVTALNFIQPADTLYQEKKNTSIPDTGNKLSPIDFSKGPGLYCQYFRAAGGTPPYFYTVRNAPPGLTMNGATGLYSGVPIKIGTFKNVIFCVTDAALTTVCLSPQIQQVCDGRESCTGFGG